MQLMSGREIITNITDSLLIRQKKRFSVGYIHRETLMLVTFTFIWLKISFVDRGQCKKIFLILFALKRYIFYKKKKSCVNLHIKKRYNT